MSELCFSAVQYSDMHVHVSSSGLTAGLDLVFVCVIFAVGIFFELTLVYCMCVYFCVVFAGLIIIGSAVDCLERLSRLRTDL